MIKRRPMTISTSQHLSGRSKVVFSGFGSGDDVGYSGERLMSIT